ncbi:MAG: FAD-binding oxidoreductase [Planctomycetota bacterium]|nr:FAD-binding protein [Planctomycetota bacterium]MDP6838833.1 FAD-binding oxidoreductase [Planctomycetota bacterium]
MSEGGAVLSETPTAGEAPGGQGGVPRHYEFVEGWGMACGNYGGVWRPRSAPEVQTVLASAGARGAQLALRGTGCSYGDASTNSRGEVLDLTSMNRILSFEPQAAPGRGRVEAEGGVTIEQLWRFLLPRGHWPRVVSGTAAPTLAGAAAMNIHGKNNFSVGTFGDAISEFDIALPNGELRTVTRASDGDLFHAAIGGCGMLGCITRLVLETHAVHSGDLEVDAIATRRLGEMMEAMEARRESSDYLVGWIDAFASGDNLGRGLIHTARYLEPGEDRAPQDTLTLAHQEQPANILGLYPKTEMWRLLRPFNNAPGMRAVNAAKCLAGRLEGMAGPQRQSHAAFAFLLDFVPNWKFAYGRRPGHGLIQYQSFVPAAAAQACFEDLLRLCQDARREPFLAVFKRHRPDPFWLTHAPQDLDDLGGSWSLALDFKVTPETRPNLWSLCERLTKRVLAAAGRFYFAKDLTLTPGAARTMFPAQNLAAFHALKNELDPQGTLQSDLWRRLFAD